MSKTTRRLVMALGLAAACGVQAQDAYPNRPIKWIVPFLPGTAPDQTVRIVADAMSGILKQPVVVDNRPGASGNLGATLAARSQPDGYTWVYSASSMSISMRMYKKPGFEVMKDFIHVGRIGLSDLTVVTSADSGITSMRDLLENARENPGKLSFGSGGVGSPAHMGGELMLSAAKAEALHVPYKGASDSTNAVIGKQVDFALAITSVALPHVASGRLVPLAVTGATRHNRMPNVPTLAEAGVPVTLVSVGGLSVPAGTPQPVVRRIADALNKALNTPEVKAKAGAMGGEFVPSTPEEYADALRSEVALAERMMKAARLEPQ